MLENHVLGPSYPLTASPLAANPLTRIPLGNVVLAGSPGGGGNPQEMTAGGQGLPASAFSSPALFLACTTQPLGSGSPLLQMPSISNPNSAFSVDSGIDVTGFEDELTTPIRASSDAS